MAETVTLEVDEPIDIGFGVTLKPGAYVGRRGTSWLGGEYRVELTSGEVKSLGGSPTPGTDTVLYDVSSFVRRGKIRVF